MPADLFRVFTESHCSGMRRPSPMSIDVVIAKPRYSENFIFDFIYRGETHRCIVVSRPLTGGDLEVGQRAELTGRWSPTVPNLFEARTVLRLHTLEDAAVRQ